ncbi:hypothetical protein [Catellatospora methionotrophica]|uniref:hypothetical protein n=1 Tax=Catellatospora methionotrophica TaxID=121620 RepID=UPI0033EAAD0D
MTNTDAPEGLGATGRELWQAVLAEFELTEPERVILREACRTADSIDGLQARLEADGIMPALSQGRRVHPALAELRQQRITLARLWTALRVPLGEGETGRTQRRGPRGVYGVGVGA